MDIVMYKMYAGQKCVWQRATLSHKELYVSIIDYR